MGLDTEANQQRLIAVYEKQKEVVLETVLKQLQYNNKLLDETDALADNELERAKALRNQTRSTVSKKNLLKKYSV